MNHVTVFGVMFSLSLFIDRPMWAASFDCAKATTEVEQMICADPRLADLDERYAIAFRSEVATSSRPDQLRAEGRSWLRDVRDACRDATCLIDAYTARINEINNEYNQVASRGGWVAPSPSVEFQHDDAPATPFSGSGAEAEQSLAAAGISSDQAELVMVGPSASRDAIANQQAAQRGSYSDGERARHIGIAGELESAVMWGVCISTLVLLGLAITNRIVIFHDLIDASWSIVAVTATAAAAFLFLRIQPAADQGATATIADYVGLAFFVLLAICCMAQTLHLAIKYNSSIAIGIVVAIFKLGAAVALVLTSIGLLGRVIDHRSSRSQLRSAAMLFVIVGMLWIALVNGDRVLERRASLV